MSNEYVPDNVLEEPQEETKGIWAISDPVSRYKYLQERKERSVKEQSRLEEFL